MKHMLIAIDGPAGAGKTTIAKALSKKLDILYLNTGALYRAFALKCINLKLDAKQPETAKFIAENTNLSVEYSGGMQHVILDDIDVTENLHTDEVSEVASIISKHQIVREKLVQIQRNTANSQSLIMDGRDIGSVVLPDANFKFYLEADVKVRAERRFNEYRQKNIAITYEEVLEDMQKRDFADTTRNISPLKKCADSIIVDCTYLNIDEVVDEFLKYIKGN